MKWGSGVPVTFHSFDVMVSLEFINNFEIGQTVQQNWLLVKFDDEMNILKVDTITSKFSQV